jgi:hypothetical protein
MHIKENEIYGPKYMQMLEFEPQTPHLFTFKILFFINGVLLHSFVKIICQCYIIGMLLHSFFFFFTKCYFILL